MDTIIRNIANLFKVKTIVTLALTGIFCYLACCERLSQEFMVVYSMVIAFYFGTQHEKRS